MWEIIIGAAIGVLLCEAPPIKRAINRFFIDVLGICPYDLDLQEQFCDICGHRIIFKKPSEIPDTCPRCSSQIKK